MAEKRCVNQQIDKEPAYNGNQDSVGIDVQRVPTLFELHEREHEKDDEEKIGPGAREQKAASEPAFCIATAGDVRPTVTDKLVGIIINPFVAFFFELLVGGVGFVFSCVLLFSALIFPPVEEFSLHFLDSFFNNGCGVFDAVAFLVKLVFLFFGVLVRSEPDSLEFFGAFLAPPLFKGLVKVFFLPQLLDCRVEGCIEVKNPNSYKRNKRQVVMKFKHLERR